MQPFHFLAESSPFGEAAAAHCFATLPGAPFRPRDTAVKPHRAVARPIEVRSRRRRMTDHSGNLDPLVVLARVRELVESTRGYIHLTASWRRKINTAATLPDSFFTTSALILDEHDWLAAASKVTGEEARDVVDDTPAILTLAEGLEQLAKGLRSTYAARRGAVGERLLLMYGIVKRHNRMQQGEGYIGQIQHLEELLRKRRRRSGVS
jgi:hypothetical protein